jgi:hypothetical protein
VKISTPFQSVAKLLEWEQGSGLFDVRVGHVVLWRLVRNVILDQYWDKQKLRDRFSHNELQWSSGMAFLNGVFFSLLHVLRLKHYPVLIMGFPRRRLEHNRWVDHFSDPLIQVFGEDSVLCVEKPFGGQHQRPTRTRNIMYYDWIMLFSVMISRVLAPFIRFLNRAAINQVSSTVSERLECSRVRLVKLLARELARVRVEELIMRGLLRVVRPRLILLTTRWVHFPLILAARSRGIPLYELQHGALAPNGFKYETPFDSYMDVDAMLTFGDYWNNVCWGLPREKTHSIGFAYIEYRKQQYRQMQPVTRRKIMLVSQPEMSSKLADIFKLLVEAYPEYSFVLRLHPQDRDRWADRYPVGSKSNVTISQSSEEELYELFRECLAVIGHNSTVLYEASFFGIPTGLLNLDGSNQCAALSYVGKYNFFEIKHIADLLDVLNASVIDEFYENPFFKRFDLHEFFQAVDVRKISL